MYGVVCGMDESPCDERYGKTKNEAKQNTEGTPRWVGISYTYTGAQAKNDTRQASAREKF